MYHIKQDKRAYKSAELLYQGLCQCVQQKDFSKITVQDLQQASSVSRATFYRHFDSLIDILHWRCNQQFLEMWSMYKPSPNAQFYDFVQYFLTYWIDNSQILEILLTIQRTDIIYTCHINNLSAFQEKFLSILPLPIDHGQYFMGIRAGIMTGVLTTWLQNGKQESVEDVLEIVKSQFEFIHQTKLMI